MPESWIDNVAARPLFRVRTWMTLLFGALSWVLASFFGIADANVASWAGTDQIVTLGELIVGLYTVAAAYFTAKRKPGPVVGVVSLPKED